MVFKKKFIFTLIFVVFLSVLPVAPVFAAKLFLSPSGGTFTVGSTFNVNIFLDTEGESVNTVKAILNFPADKMQLISPSVGQSIISVWTAQPIFNNQTGSIRLTGGIPNGVNVQSGLVTSLTFRVKQIASPALVRFSDESRVLANDGSGTDVLQNVQSGIYNFILPPPQGPIVSSQTHPDQSKWYASKDVVLNWASVSLVEEYSYVLDQNPAGVPDNISEGSNVVVTYNDLSDGTHYFHIKELLNGRWGGTTHFAVNVDTSPPADFPVNIRPNASTTNRQPVIEFFTTDQISGLRNYELKIVQVTSTENAASFAGGTTEEFFIEATSPYVPPELTLGKYDVLVRAYDNAGNYREVVQEMNIISPLLQIEKEGVVFGGALRMSWLFMLGSILVIVLAVGFIAWRVRTWHFNVEFQRNKRELPNSIREQLQDLKKYRSKYGKLVIALAFGTTMLFAGAPPTFAQEQILNPPYISTVSKDISNEEIFYAGGKADIPNSTIALYIQNLKTGETTTRTITADKKGDWFYRHDAFLSGGEYLLWAQTTVGEQTSPPTPQTRFSVQHTAIQFGSSRISTENLYLGASGILLLMLLLLLAYIVRRMKQARKKYAAFIEEIREAQEAVRRGFAVLRRDVETELHSLSSKKSKHTLSKKEIDRERELLQDLSDIEQKIGKEILDIEGVEYRYE